MVSYKLIISIHPFELNISNILAQLLYSYAYYFNHNFLLVKCSPRKVFEFSSLYTLISLCIYFLATYQKGFFRSTCPITAQVRHAGLRCSAHPHTAISVCHTQEFINFIKKLCISYSGLHYQENSLITFTTI